MNIDVDTTDDQSYHIADNFAEDFIEFSRSKQVLNEQQVLVVQMVVATGFLDDWRHFDSAIVTGSSSGGKSHMLREVTTASLDYADAAENGDFLYELTGGSDKATIDDDELDSASLAYLHELNKIPDEMREFIKSISEDGGFKYGRNVADDDSDSGRSTVHIEKDPLPVLFSFADENEDASGDDQELRSRLVEVKVDEHEAKNEAVHRMKWGEEHITLPDAEHEYIFDAPDVAHAVKSHMRDIPRDLSVVLPTNSGRFDGDDWHAGDVASPLFNFKRTEATRASAYIASLVRGSAVLNYHSRDAWCETCGNEYVPDAATERDYECECGEDLSLVVDPVDLGNVIACRDVLLATTHNLTAKKFAVIDAIMERGGPAPDSETALQATKDDVIEHIQESTDIATLSKREITDILDDLVEQLILNKRDHPEDARKNIYVYDGAAAFERPNIYDYYEHFSDVVDPIRQQPIEQTIDEQLAELNAKLETDAESLMGDSGESMSAESAMSGDLSDFDDADDPAIDDVSETAQRVYERVQTTLGDAATVGTDVELEHMVGVTPVTEDGDLLVAEREPSGADKVDGFMSPDEWDDCDDFDDVEQTIGEAITELQDAGCLSITEADGDGVDIELS